MSLVPLASFLDPFDSAQGKTFARNDKERSGSACMVS